MITQDIAQNRLLEITNRQNFQFQKWEKSKFVELKLASTTEKGNVGRDFLKDMLAQYDYGCEECERGQYDLSVQHNGTTVKLKVRVATLDSNDSFQFNGIRLNTHYTHLFCLGVSPDRIGYLIIMGEKLGTDEYKLVPMSSENKDEFKLTRQEGALKSFNDFRNDLVRLWK